LVESVLRRARERGDVLGGFVRGSGDGAELRLDAIDLRDLGFVLGERGSLLRWVG